MHRVRNVVLASLFLAIPVVVFFVILSGPSMSPELDSESLEAISDPPIEFTPDDAFRSYEQLRGRLDPANPGRGIADYPGNPVSDVPKAYAMVLIAEAERRRHDPDHDLGLARTCARWLLEHADENADGVLGWGVPVAWDAYGDGSENPVDTEYAISTSLVVQALLDWSEFSLESDRDRIQQVVAESLAEWANPAHLSKSGMLAYSLRESDRRYDTFNPAAHLAGQMQRFSTIAEPGLATTLSEAADQTMQVLLDHVRNDSDGNWYWSYSIQEDTPNDLAHAVYIMQGIDTYVAQGGRFREEFDMARIAGHLHAFLPSDEGFLFAWPTFREDVKYPARSYDIGAALWFCASRPELDSLSGRLAGFIPMYLKDDGSYRKYPDAGDKKGGDDMAVGEYQAYVLAGLSAFSR